MKIVSTNCIEEAPTPVGFTKHSEERSVNQDGLVKGVVTLTIGKESDVTSSFAEDNSEASLDDFPLQFLF